ncbi:MAG: carboxypeptidase regulatory-like domain-containing protein [Alphaproteobacteria bacterium]
MKRTLIAASVLAALSLTPLGARAEYEAATVDNAGVITGRVLLGDATPEFRQHQISKNTEVCGLGPRHIPLVHANEDALLDVVVYLEDIERGKPFAAAAKKVTIDQKACSFEPHLSVMADGGELEAINSDPLLHNIHVYEISGGLRQTVMNVSQPERGNIVSKRISLERGHALKIECDAHDFMHASVFVARNPYYAVVDERGRFEIGEVPPGDYMVRAWHGVLGIRAQRITVPANGTVFLRLSF